MELLLHLELTVITVIILNELITLVASGKKIGEKIITISSKNAVFDLLCFINLAK